MQYVQIVPYVHDTILFICAELYVLIDDMKKIYKVIILEESYPNSWKILGMI